MLRIREGVLGVPGGVFLVWWLPPPERNRTTLQSEPFPPFTVKQLVVHQALSPSSLLSVVFISSKLLQFIIGMVGIGGSLIIQPILAFVFVATRSSNSDTLGADRHITTLKMTDATEDILARLRSLGLSKKDLPHHLDMKRASVLVPLFERKHDFDGESSRQTSSTQQYKSNLHVLFTQRPRKMSSHGGEVCFPGGRQDPEDDGDDVFTALREAHEEVGLHPRYIDTIGRMETVESKHSLCVTPIIGLVQPPTEAEPSRLKMNEDEVEAAFAVPLEYFTIPENCVSKVRVKYGRGELLMRTYLFDDPESGRMFTIWGLTAHIIHEVARLAYRKDNS